VVLEKAHYPAKVLWWRAGFSWRKSALAEIGVQPSTLPGAVRVADDVLARAFPGSFIGSQQDEVGRVIRRMSSTTAWPRIAKARGIRIMGSVKVKRDLADESGVTLKTSSGDCGHVR